MYIEPRHRPQPYGDGHRAYLAAGWAGVLPIGLQAGLPVTAQKAAPPDGYTGADGAWPTDSQVKAWAAQWPQVNLGLRLPPDIVGIDVDQYVSRRTGEIKQGGELLVRLADDYGSLPATWRSTSRETDNPSGVRLFRVPAGLRLATQIPGGIEIIQYHHRYAVCWPSIHPEDRTYRWIDPAGEEGGVPRYDDESIPDLPWGWQDGLAAPDRPESADNPPAAPQHATRDAWAGAVLRAYTESMERLRQAQVGGRHDTAVAVSCGFARQEQLGLAGATSAMELFGQAFVSLVAADRGGPAQAQREWQAAVDSARVTVAGTASTVAAERESLDEFWARHMVRRASLHEDESEPSAEDAPGPSAESEPGPSAEPDDEVWERADLGPIVDGDIYRHRPTVLSRGDHGAFYRGLVNYIHGTDGVGKSFVALIAAMETMAAGARVMWLDFEDTAVTVVSRLRDYDVDPKAILDRFYYFHPESPSSRAIIDTLAATVAADDIALVIIDSVGEAFAVDGVDENHDNEVAPWFRYVARRLADAGAAVIPIDHGTKAGDTPFYPSGSKRKRAMVSGTAVYVEVIRPLTREDGGRLRLVCAKDRHGTYRRGEAIGELDVFIRPNGKLGWSFGPPPAEPESPAIAGLEVAMRAAVRAVRRLSDLDPEPPSRNMVLAAMDVKARAEVKRSAIDLAVERGILEEISGTRSSRRLVLVNQDEPPED